jgi:hypothetical protein
VTALPLVAALALAAAAPAPGAGPACGLPALRPGPLPFRTGELLTYDVDVMGVVKAGTLTLAVEPPMSRGTLLPLRARVKNTSVFAQARRVRGFALAWVDATTLRPQRYRDEAEEDGVRKTTDTRFDRPGPLTMEWVLGERKGTATLPRSGDAMDLLSTVYYLRAAPLAPGSAFCFDLVANRRFWHLQGEVAAKRERVESAAGAFDTVRVDLTLTRADAAPGTRGAAGRRTMHLWFSTDDRRLPVAAVSEIDIGPVRAMLARVSVPTGGAPGSGTGSAAPPR